MKFLSVFLFACISAAWAQTAPAPGPGGTPAPQMPDIPDQTTIAVFDDGVKLTMGDFKKIFAVLPPDSRALVLRDRKSFLQQWAFMRKLAHMGEEAKLDQASPAKEQLEYYRLMILSQAKLAEAANSTTVEPAEIVKFYDTEKERFKENTAVRIASGMLSFRRSVAKSPSFALEVSSSEFSFTSFTKSAPPRISASSLAALALASSSDGAFPPLPNDT